MKGRINVSVRLLQYLKFRVYLDLSKTKYTKSIVFYKSSMLSNLPNIIPTNETATFYQLPLYGLFIVRSTVYLKIIQHICLCVNDVLPPHMRPAGSLQRKP